MHACHAVCAAASGTTARRDALQLSEYALQYTMQAAVSMSVLGRLLCSRGRQVKVTERQALEIIGGANVICWCCVAGSCRMCSSRGASRPPGQVLAVREANRRRCSKPLRPTYWKIARLALTWASWARGRAVAVHDSRGLPSGGGRHVGGQDRVRYVATPGDGQEHKVSGARVPTDGGHIRLPAHT